jgi:hypothetical protein
MKHLQVLLDNVGTGKSAIGTGNSGLASTSEAVLGGNALDTVGRVDVLDEGELPAGGTTLAGSDGGGSQEVLPNAEPALSVLSLDLVLVTHPVPVPAPEGGRVVDTDGVDGLDLEAGALELVDDETERGGSISTGENVLVHEQTPNEVLVLPGLAETSDLQEEGTIILKHLVDLRQESRKVTDTNVLSHLETGDLLVTALNTGSITVVGADNAGLVLLNASLAKTIVTPGSLIASESDTGNVSTIVDGGVLGEGSPATAEIENLVTGLGANLLTDDGQLVVLKLLEGLLRVDIADNAGGVDHAGAKEPGVEVITSVVVVTDLLLVWEMNVRIEYL